MRVALLTDSDAFAGTERHVLDLSAALASRGVDVRVACPADSPLARRARDAGGQFAPVERGGRAGMAAIRAVARLLRAGEADVVHAHNGRSAFIAAAARRLAGRGSVVLTQHFLAPAYAARRGVRGAASRAAHAWIDRNVDHVIAISRCVADGVIGRGEKDDAGVSVVHNGIAAPTPTRGRAETRASIGVPESAPLAVCAARLESEKRIDVLIDAWRRVVDAMPDAVCLVAGEGGRRATLERRLDGLGLHGRVRLLGFRPDAIDLIAAADAMVLPSDAEPFGLVVLEAFALGTPVVATDAGGPAEIVTDGETGVLARPADAESLSCCVTAVLGDAGLRRRLAAAARESFDAQFTADRMAREAEQVYARVAEAAAARRAGAPIFTAAGRGVA